MLDNDSIATLRGKVVLVTGASRGIGWAIAKELSRLGAYVVGTSTSEKGAIQITEAMRDLGLQGEGQLLDVTSGQNVSDLIASLIRNKAAPQVLINNAGITRDTLLMRMKDSDWLDVIETNLHGAFRVTREVVKHMVKARWGRIVNIGSVVSSMGNAGQANYVASKAGLDGLTRALSLELASRAITVNTVSPGFIDTDMTKVLTESQRLAILEKVPAARLGQPIEVAKVVAFLVSNDAAYITGANIPVNGGIHL